VHSIFCPLLVGEIIWPTRPAVKASLNNPFHVFFIHSREEIIWPTRPAVKASLNNPSYSIPLTLLAEHPTAQRGLAECRLSTNENDALLLDILLTDYLQMYALT